LGKLNSLKSRLPLIGDVRGIGLMIGVELVTDDEMTPAAQQADAVRAACLERGVLVGVGGVYGNVVRFQPPLVIEREQIDAALEVIGQSLAEVAGEGGEVLEPVAAQSAR
ncbi:MAG: aminotransferase class III-fold pyridoxal phosphate-dependent enzyme, partial [Pyrinomonadaceae bacterium]